MNRRGGGSSKSEQTQTGGGSKITGNILFEWPCNKQYYYLIKGV